MATKKSVSGAKGSDSIYDEFETTSTKTLKKIAETEEEIISSGSRGDRLTLKDGVNKIRFWPKRKGEESFYKMRASHWYKIPDSSSKKGDTVPRVVPDAKIHGGMEKDISEVYLEAVNDKLDSSDAAESRKIKKANGTGYNGGLLPNISWVAYASNVKDGKSISKPAEFDFKKTVRDALNAEVMVEDEDEAIEVDPFTHPKDGRYVQITYDSKAKKAADYYKVRVSDNKCPLSVDELIEFKKLPPLSELDIFKYTIKDFETALEGLQQYDEEEEIGVFDSDDFQELVKIYKKELVNKLKGTKDVDSDEDEGDDLPFKEDGKDKKKTTGKLAVKAKKSEPEEEEEEEVDENERDGVDNVQGDEFDAMDREELKQYKVDNELEIKIFKNDTDDTIREKIREAVAANEVHETEDEPEEEEAEEAPPAKKATAGTKNKLSLDDIKNKLKGTVKK